MGLIEWPSTIRTLLANNEIDCLTHTFIGTSARFAQIVQRPQHVVVPAGRKREFSPVEIALAVTLDHCSCRERPEQLSLQQILLAAEASIRNSAGGAFRFLVLEQSFQDADGRVEGRPLAPRRVAIPAAVRQLLAQ